MASKTLLLVYIHGFKSDDQAFEEFPTDFKTHLTTTNPDLKVENFVYPKYSTQGDLALAATAFKDSLVSKVLDLEKQHEPPNSNPIYEPTIDVILVAHSMGGFVASDALFEILDETKDRKDSDILFPRIKGILAFDTPYNGLSRSMFAYGAFNGYQTASGAWNIFSTGTGLLTGAGSKQALSSAAQTGASHELDRRSDGSWTRWSALAARTGTYGAIMAGGVAAWTYRDSIMAGIKGINRENLSKINYTNTKDAITNYPYGETLSNGMTYVSRESIGEGFAWLAGHLKFVGALTKTKTLEGRLERLNGLEGVGVKVLFSSLGENGVWSGGYFVPRRTFCAIPAKGEEEGGLWTEAANKKAENEIVAHTGMFKKDKNPGYHDLVDRSGELVGTWTKAENGKGVKDEWEPSGEQLEKVKSESKTWNDDGEVLDPPGGEGDEGQLDAILKSENMPEGEDGGVDEEELKKASDQPLPVDEGNGEEGQSSDQAQSSAGEGTKIEGKDSSRKIPLQTEQSFWETLARMKQRLDEAGGEITSSDTLTTPITEPEKPGVLNESTSEEPAKEEATQAPVAEEPEPSSKETSSAPQKGWLDMIPGRGSTPAKDQAAKETPEDQGQKSGSWMPSLPSSFGYSKKPESSTDETKPESSTSEKTEEPISKEGAEEPSGKSWLSSVPRMPYTSAASTKEVHFSDEVKDGSEEPATKSWSSMMPSMPSAPSWSSKSKVPEKKSEVPDDGCELLAQTKSEEGEEQNAEANTDPRKKWFGVV